MSDLLTTLDPVVFYDQRPSHERPDWLVEAHEAWDDAISDYDKLVEREYADDNLMPDYDAIDQAWAKTHDMEIAYHNAHTRWQAEAADRLLVCELSAGAFAEVSGSIRPDWDAA